MRSMLTMPQPKSNNNMKKKLKSIDNKTDLTGNFVVLNTQWYWILKMDEPKHLPDIKPLIITTITGEYSERK